MVEIDIKYELMKRSIMEISYLGTNRDQEILEQLKNSSKRVYVYGSAKYAEVVVEFLQNHDITVEGILVDEKYLNEKAIVCGLKVYAIERLDDLESINIVIGFCNVDKARFLRDSFCLLKTNVFLLWEPVELYHWDEEYIHRNEDVLNEIYNALADNHSKEILRLLIEAKLNHRIGKLLDYADNKQYFNELTYECDPENEIFVDCGAYVGDTIEKYCRFTGNRYKKIYALEPDAENFATMKRNLGKTDKIDMVCSGAWNKRDILCFEPDGSSSCIQQSGNKEISVISIDELVKGEEVSFIKMDIEGAEIPALEGARNTITSNIPKLAICCYHKEDDIVDIYRFLKSIEHNQKGYKMYLRHHSNGAYETVFYAIPYYK